MGIALLAAYTLGTVGVVWFAVDSARIPPPIWYWSGYSRPGWWGAMLLCLVAFGIPALIAALVWRFGEQRKALRLDDGPLRGHQGQDERVMTRGGRDRHHMPQLVKTEGPGAQPGSFETEEHRANGIEDTTGEEQSELHP